MSFLEFLIRFLPSFLAILMAGAAITWYNHRFIKEQRRREVADALCSNMERHIDDYFNGDDRSNQNVLDMRINAYIETFMLFWSDAKFSGTIKKEMRGEIRDECLILLELDEDEEITREERLRRSLLSVARIRYFLTV